MHGKVILDTQKVYITDSFVTVTVVVSSCKTADKIFADLIVAQRKVVCYWCDGTACRTRNFGNRLSYAAHPPRRAKISIVSKEKPEISQNCRYIIAFIAVSVVASTDVKNILCMRFQKHMVYS